MNSDRIPFSSDTERPYRFAGLGLVILLGLSACAAGKAILWAVGQ